MKNEIKEREDRVISWLLKKKGFTYRELKVIKDLLKIKYQEGYEDGIEKEMDASSTEPYERQ